MKICNKYQKNFDAISETFWRKFWKNFVKYQKYRGNSRIYFKNVWWKFQENFTMFADRLEGNFETKFGEVLGNFKEDPMNF